MFLFTYTQNKIKIDLLFFIRKAHYTQVKFYKIILKMLNNLILILGFTLATFIIAIILYPLYIRLLRKLKAGKTIRSNTATWEKSEIFAKLHEHKAWTPTMWWGLFLLMMLLMVWISWISQKLWRTNYHLWNRQETYIILFWFFSMWLIGLIDDILNILNVWKVKWLNMRAKMLGLILFSGWISYRFYHVLWIDYINLAPIFGTIHLWRWFPILTFIATIFIVNAVNITDWLDWLAGWLNIFVLITFAVALFISQRYLATTVLWICISTLVAFMFFNINPAKIFMGDSGAFALWWLIASTAYLLNMSIWIFIPAFIVFLIFIIDLCTSGLQMFWKKVFHHKLFPIAPFHHYLEYKWIKEYTIVMYMWLIQTILTVTAIIVIFWQFL